MNRPKRNTRGISGGLALGIALVTQVTVADPNASALPASPDAVKVNGQSYSVVLQSMKDELKRTSELNLPGAAKPYYVSALVHDLDSDELFASNGAMIKRERDHVRVGTVQMRIGDYQFDDSNFLSPGGFDVPMPLPVEDDYDALRRALWLLSDQGYKRAVERFEAKKASKKNWSDSGDALADFSRESPTRLLVNRPKVVSLEPYEAVLRNVSRVFLRFPFIQASRATLSVKTYTRYFTSTEGAEFVEPKSTLTVALACSAQADDGMPIHDYSVKFAVDGAGLPTEAELLAEASRIAEELGQIRSAPLVEDFDGPVLFEGEAAAQLVSLAFEGELSGAPPPRPLNKSPSEFAGRIGQRVLPKGIWLVDDPSMGSFDQVPLIGAYRVDNQGIPGQKVTLVADGVLTDLLMTRAPRKGADHSNGHARSAFPGIGGADVSNLFLSARGAIVAGDMHQRLLAEVRKAKAPFGLIVSLLSETIDAVSRRDDPTAPCMCHASPIVRQITPDGKLRFVRGARLERLDARLLENIVAVGKTPFVHNCDSMSPLRQSQAAVSPALLLSHAVVKRPTGPQPKLPSFSRP